MHELSKKQKLAISRTNRALKALFDADIRIAGMDDNLVYATTQAINESDDYGYPEAANPCKFAEHGELTGSLNDNGCYTGSGGY